MDFEYKCVLLAHSQNCIQTKVYVSVLHYFGPSNRATLTTSFIFWFYYGKCLNNLEGNVICKYTRTKIVYMTNCNS